MPSLTERYLIVSHPTSPTNQPTNQPQYLQHLPIPRSSLILLLEWQPIMHPVRPQIPRLEYGLGTSTYSYRTALVSPPVSISAAKLVPTPRIGRRLAQTSTRTRTHHRRLFTGSLALLVRRLTELGRAEELQNTFPSLGAKAEAALPIGLTPYAVFQFPADIVLDLYCNSPSSLCCRLLIQT